MPLHSLVRCQDANTTHLVSRAFNELGIEVEHFVEPEMTLRKLRNQRFDAFVLDDAVPGAALIRDCAKFLPSCKNSLGIVVAERQTTLVAPFGKILDEWIAEQLASKRFRQVRQ